MAETHTVFYRVELADLVTYEVVSNTARTWVVRRTYSGGHFETRTVKSAQIGRDFHITPAAALTAAAAECEREIGFIQQRLQRRRTTLGMIESQLRKLGLPPAADAVDPVAASSR